MRYITNTAETTVTLREELDYVQKYLYCMKVRYQSSLNYSIDVDESLLDQPVPKLIISLLWKTLSNMVLTANRHGLSQSAVQ